MYGKGLIYQNEIIISFLLKYVITFFAAEKLPCNSFRSSERRKSRCIVKGLQCRRNVDKTVTLMSSTNNTKYSVYQEIN